MKQTMKMFCDGKSLFLTLSKKKSKKIIVLCIGTIVSIFCSILWALYQSSTSTVMNLIFAGAIAYIFLLTLFHKRIFWELRGKEYLVITAESLRYQYDYGITISSIKTITSDQLRAHVAIKETGKRKGKLLLNAFDNVICKEGVTIYKTKIAIDKEKEDIINEKLNEIYFNEFYSSYDFHKISLN